LPLNIACLHTVASNAPLFDAAAGALPGGALRLTHCTRPDLLRDPTPETREEAARLLRDLTGGADAVLLTCSTIGAAADLASGGPCPILRADAALAEAATRSGGTVQVLYAAPSTRQPTRALFEAAANRTGSTIEMRFVEGAWAMFLAGDTAGYYAAIAAAAEGLEGRIVLAQASMAGAASLMQEVSPLTVPGIGVMAAARAALLARNSR